LKRESITFLITITFVNLKIDFTSQNFVMFHNLTPNGVLQFEQVPTISSLPLFSDTIIHVLVTLSSLIFVRPETNIQIPFDLKKI